MSCNWTTKTFQYHHIFSALVAFIFLLQMCYYISYFKKYLWETHEIEEVQVSMGVSSSDIWMSQRAYLTRDVIIKLRENSCQIPILNPFSKPMVHFFQPAYVNCSTNEKFYFQSYVENQGSSGNLDDNPQSMIIMLNPVPDSFRCCYKQLRFSNKFQYYKIESDDCEFFSGNKTIVPSNTEYLIVKCWNTTEKYRNVSNSKLKSGHYPHHYELLFYVPAPSHELLQRKNKILSQERKREDELLNVIIFGFDQVSRANFIRLLGKTFRYLRTDLDAIDLQGFNKVGDATLNNTLALLTGHDMGDIKNNSKWWKGDGFFDDCPWIWKNFSEKGYITGYADDRISIFDYRFNGFQTQPTDYTMQPFIGWYWNWTMHRWRKYGSSQCVGNELTLELLQDRARKFSTAVKNYPYFHFMWSTQTDQPPAGYPANVDKGALKTLQYFKMMGVLNRSLVILVSDHGWRTGDVMLNSQARLENRLSFGFLLLPQWFKEKYPIAYSNLKENQYRLTTPYDIHSTLEDVLNPLTQLSNEVIDQRMPRAGSKGVSLFLPIPKDRTCAAANIDEEWCACTSYKPFSADSPVAVHLANYAVTTLNSWIHPYPSCKQFSLDKVIDVGLKVASGSAHPLINLLEAHQFRVMFSTHPKDKSAKFEVTIFTDVDYWRTMNNKNISMSGEVFRLNRYGKADCIKIYSLKSICVCNGLPEAHGKEKDNQ